MLKFSPNCCSAAKTISATINQPADLALTATVTRVVCYGGTDGDINVTVTGGTPAYTYLWPNGASSEDLSNLAACTYTVTVTDMHNCTKLT